MRPAFMSIQQKGNHMPRQKKIAVLIPCYNEGRTVRKVVTDFKNELPEAEIYVYDNNSTDNTIEEATAAGAIVRKETRQGKGNVMRTMFREIDADCYLLVDGDDTYPAEHARELCRMVLEDNIDMAIGDRLSSTYFTENKRMFHNTGNVVVNRLVNKFFHGNITDVMTGYRAMSRLFVKTFPVLSQGFEIETEMNIFALDKGMAIGSAPITYRDRPEGSESKLQTLPDGIRVIKTIIRLFKDYKPLPFFGTIAGILAAIAIILFIPVCADFVHTGIVAKFPTLIGCGFIGIAALLSLTCGMILDSVVKQGRRDFEIKKNVIQRVFSKNY